MARRRSATASSWPRIASSATVRLQPVEQLFDGADDLTVERGLRLRGAHHHDAALLRVGDLEVAIAHATVEGQVHLLERVELAVADPLDALGRVEIEQERQVRHDAPRGQRVEITDGLEIHA